VTLEPGDSGWAFTMIPTRMQHAGIAVGSQVPVELSPQGPQRGDLAEDISAALEADPAAGIFFDTLAQLQNRLCSAFRALPGYQYRFGAPGRDRRTGQGEARAAHQPPG
jgi:hypothetical protein